MLFKLILPVVIFLALIAGVLLDSRGDRESLNKRAILSFVVGLILVFGYAIYAVIFSDVNFLDVVLLKTSPNDVKNIWGEKNFFYTPSIGYAFIATGLVLQIVKPWLIQKSIE